MSPPEPSTAAAIEALGYAGAAGLVVADGPVPTNLATRFMWHELSQRVDLSAAFFQSGVPLVGFTAASASDLRQLREQLWNYGRLPALIAVTDDASATVYNALRLPTDESHGSGVLANGLLSGTTSDLEPFRRREVESGAIARLFTDSFRTSDRVDSVLLANLRTLRHHLAPEGESTTVPHADVVIGASILTAYLSDRGVLTREHMASLCQVDTLQECLNSGRRTFTAMLTGLAQRFNGDVFGPAIDSVRHLRSEDLGQIARFLQGEDMMTGQGVLWPYNFSAIPSEVISSVYETLLDEDRHRHASFYTPRAMVNLVLDEVIPLDTVFEGSIADLSCGSGAFITEAFRRIAFQRRIRGDRIDIHGLSVLLRERVFGVDIDDFASRLTVFGLYLALLEEVEPRTIWDEVVLPPLYMRSVITSDAFADIVLQDRQFDVVVGNPPWKSQLSDRASSFLRNHGRNVGDKQIAQAFVWLAEHVLKPGGRLGLVLPAKSSLYNRSAPNRRFRADLFGRLRVRTLIDLSLVRRNLFSGAIGPSIVVVADAPHSDVTIQKSGVYLAIRPRIGSGIIDGFVVAPEDFKTLTPGTMQNDDFAWKVFLWGNQQDMEVLRHLKAESRSLGSLALDEGWHVAQGIKVAGRQHDASDLIGLSHLDQNLGQLMAPRLGELFSRRTLHRSQDRQFFETPKLVISRTLSNNRIGVAVLEEPALFSSNLTGIAISGDAALVLPLLGLVASSSVIQYWQFFTSASWGVERPSIETNEIVTWPMPPMTADDAIRADSVWRTLGKRGVTDENRALVDDFVADLYKLSEAERRQIEAGVERSLSADRPARVFNSTVSDNDLNAYGSALVTHLATGWQTVRPSAAIMRRGGHAGVKVHFATDGAESPAWTNDEWSRAIDSLDSASSTTAVVSQPSLLYFEASNVYLIKSLDADRWSRGSAFSDGDDIYSAAIFGDHVAD